MAISRTPAVPGTPREVPLSPAAPRRPFRDNPRLILVGILLLLAALASLLWLADRSARLSPDFLAGFVLYALSATNFMMLLALGFFLVRNVVKLVVERRRALPFARFRAKLVALLLGLTLVPAVLVLAVGSQVVLTAVDRWFNAPMDEGAQLGQYHRLGLLPRAAPGGERRGRPAGPGAVARRPGQRRRGRARR